MDPRIAETLERLDFIELEVGEGSLSRQDARLSTYSPFSRLTGEEKRALVGEAIREVGPDRAAGCLAGMTVGDAVGHPLEFLPAADEPGSRGSSFDLESMSYSNPNNAFNLLPGQWTDDASMGLCIADSLIARRRYDGSDIRVRFWSWWHRGYNNSFRNDPSRSRSVGLGGNISRSLGSLRPGEPPPPRFAADREDSGIGSLMRLGAVPVFFHSDLAAARRYAAESSYTTHPGRIAAEACAFVSFLIARALGADRGVAGDAAGFLDGVAAEYLDLLANEAGPGIDEVRALLESSQPDSSTERCWCWRSETLDIEGTLERRGSSYNGHPVLPGYFGAYCMDGLAVALHAVYHTSSFDRAIERCVNFLGDADSTASVAGQIAGAIYGLSAIDPRFIENLQRWDDGETALRGVLLYELGRAPR